jgi:glycosyltransferase involved in cell wall biosynthesis
VSLRKLRIALVAPPLLPVPPTRYGGLERIVAVLADGLLERGHDVTLFAPGDSTFAGRLVPTVPSGLWNEGFHPDPGAHFARTIELVLGRAHEFDVIHSHLDQHGFALADASSARVITTIHGRTDVDPMLGAIRAHPRARLVAISDSQRGFVPEANWVATIYHGLPFTTVPQGPGGEDLVFVGRVSRDKGVADVIDVARRSGRRLRVAAKVLDPRERETFETIVVPAIDEGIVDFIGEVDEPERDRLVGASLATIMLSHWPEPFGLVAIESLATGTPVIASRNGALPEIVVDGVDGFVVDNAAAGAAAVERVAGLDRARIQRRAFERFDAARMLDRYEELFERVLEGNGSAP